MQYLQTFEANVSVNTSNISFAKITFVSNVFKYCMQNMNTLYFDALIFEYAMYFVL